MSIDELKQNIEQRTGIPAALLTGETAEETIAQARALLAYKRESEQTKPQTTADQFSAWAKTMLGTGETQDAATAALAEIEEAVRVDAGGYPMVKDGGQLDVSKLPDPRPVSEQFAEWYNRQNAFNPFEDKDGWKPLF